MKPSPNTLLDVSDLKIYYELDQGRRVYALNGVSFKVEPGQRIGLVGESGSGKSTLAKTILHLLPANSRVTDGTVLFQGRDLVKLDENAMNTIRWQKISLVTQSAMNALNPVARISDQFIETFMAHGISGKSHILQEAQHLFEMVGLNKKRIFDYPHQFSGGMRQRVILAMAIALSPDLIIADEPTTALDVIMQAQIINLLEDLSVEKNISLILITHDISIVAETCQKVGVMYAGCLMEFGPLGKVFNTPYHPYTMGLKGAFPSIKELEKSLISIPGSPPQLIRPPAGCGFAPRCPFVIDLCQNTIPQKVEAEPEHWTACHRFKEAVEFRDRAKEIFLTRDSR